MNTLENLLKYCTHRLTFHSNTPRLDAELLLMQITGLSRAQLYCHLQHSINAQNQSTLNEWIKRRIQGEPIAYLLGKKAFWNLDLIVSPDVLIPRPETECLIEWTLEKTANTTQPLKIADLGVGSGCIALALAKENPNWTIHATDSSRKALAIAQKNAKRHNIHNVTFFQGSWHQALPDTNYDMIISNPPYIAYSDSHLKSLKFEPEEALKSGKEGLDAIKVLIQDSPYYLKSKGWLIFEHGYTQQKTVLKLLRTSDYRSIKGHSDLTPLPRYISAVKI